MTLPARTPVSTATMALLFVLLLATSAAAAPVTATFRSDKDVEVSGHVRVSAPHGASAFARHDGYSGSFELQLVDAVVKVYTTERWASQFARLEARVPEETSVEHIPLRNATLRVEVLDERLVYAILPYDTGAVRVAGPVEAVGLPSRLPHDVSWRTVTVSESAEWDWTWSEGWWFLGRYNPSTPLRGFPSWSVPMIETEGRVRLLLDGGTAHFALEDGSASQHRLGRQYEPGSSAALGPLSAGREIARWILVDGHVANASLPAGAEWGVASAEMDWRAQGELAWSGATGQLDTEGESRTLAGARVRMLGDLEVGLAHATPHPGHPESFVYTISGDASLVTVDGVAVERAPADAVGASAAMGLLALLAASIGTDAGRTFTMRAFVGAYTRLTPGEVLDHPTRRRMVDLVRAQPGIHARELHRLIGGSWTPLRFHLRMLEQHRHLKVVSDGRYHTVFPSDAPPTTVITHPIQRRLHEMLPADGASVDVRELQESLGISRQLLHYHLSGLEARGLATVQSVLPVGRKRVARKEARVAK